MTQPTVSEHWRK